MAELISLKQTGNVQEFLDSFDGLLNQVELSEEYSISCFLKGLKPKIKVQVKMLSPRTLTEAYNLAKLAEHSLNLQNNQRNFRLLLPTPTASGYSNSRGNLQFQGAWSRRSGEGNNFLGSNGKGRKQIYLLEVGEEEEEWDVTENFSKDENKEESTLSPQMSIHALDGTVDYRTMRVQYSDELQRLLSKHTALFEAPSGLPPQRSRDHRIILKEGTLPVNVKPYKYVAKQKDEIERMIKKMLDSGVIMPSDKFPIHVIEELLDELGGAKFFSKLNLRSSYHQIKMADQDIEKTVFRSHNGHYEFVVMPFGLTNAPSTFQSLMNHIFQLSKCTFGQTEVEYLGHIITQQGVAANPGKVKVMVEWHVPKTMKELRRFLGLTGYYRRFVKGYGVIARPLTDILKKDRFEWSEAATKAFEALKVAMSTTLVLALPDFSQEFIIETDACGYGIEVVLIQGDHPLASLRKALHDKHQHLSVYEKKMMAIVTAVDKWRPYLIGRHFLIITDHQSLKYLLEQRVSTPSQQKWVAKLMGYDYSIMYKKGKENVAADALSRFPMNNIQLLTISTVSSNFLARVMSSYEGDQHLQQLATQLSQNESYNPIYWLKEGIIYRKGKIVALFEAQGVHLHHSTAYHPQSDGQTRVVNNCLESYLRCMCNDRPKDWEFAGQRNHIRLLKHHLLLAQSRMKAQADKHRTPMSFNEYDMTFVKLQPYRQVSLKNHSYHKLSPKYFGPFKIIKRVDIVAYQLDLPPHAKIHHTFHVSQLKLQIGNAPVMPNLPITLSPHGYIILELEIVLDKILLSKNNRQVTQLLVK
ncbi:uncharacterized protein LOC142168223 [Nicotiana tabacum]|uniref:Uncharacterized protein LOC142168223 n=1 Tax=Nicotiana tabacum TaxID=4097 RepID=A0AC58SJ16_TOBAC